MEDLNDLVLFASVVTHGSFSGVTRALGIPELRVSRRVAGLETRLRVRLLQRLARAVHATDVSSAFFMHCESMTRAVHAAFEVAEHAGEKPPGRLRMSCPVGMAHVFIAPVLSKLLCVQLDVRLELGVTNRHVDMIGDGYDVTLRVHPTLDDSNLIVHSFGVNNQVLAVSPSFVAEHGPFEMPESMRGVTGVGVDGAAGERMRWRLTVPEGDVVDIEYTPALVTDDLYLMGQTVLAGIGVAQLPFNLCVESAHDGRLVVLLPGYRLPAHQFHAVLPPRRGLVPAVRAFTEFLAGELPGMTANVSRCYEDITR